MKKSFIVIGLGRFGLNIVKTMADLKCPVIAIDINEEQVKKAAHFVEHCAACDSTKKEVLEELGVKNIDHSIVAIGNNLLATILTTINLVELGVKNITVRVDDAAYVALLKRVGATEVIIPEEASAKSLANQLVSDNFLEYFRIDASNGVVQIRIPDDFKPITLIQLDSRNRFDVNIVGITREGKFSIPKGVDTIMPGDILLAVGKSSKILKLDEAIREYK